MPSVINYFAQLPIQDGYTTIKRSVTTDALGNGTFDYGNIPAGTQLVACLIHQTSAGALTSAVADTVPFLNGTTMGYGRSDVAAAAIVDDWAPYTFTASQQGILTINMSGLAAAVETFDFYLYVFIPQIPCP